MKIIEALKTLKANEKKIADLINKIQNNSARLSNQTSPYGDVGAATGVVNGWMDSIRQTLRDKEVLTNRIHRTNVQTKVAILIGGNVVEKTIDEWLVRAKNGVNLQVQAYKSLTDRGLKEAFVSQPDGTNVPVTIVRHFDAGARDKALSILAEESSLISSSLEIVNATTDLVE